MYSLSKVRIFLSRWAEKSNEIFFSEKGRSPDPVIAAPPVRSGLLLEFSLRKAEEFSSGLANGHDREPGSGAAETGKPLKSEGVPQL